MIWFILIVLFGCFVFTAIVLLFAYKMTVKTHQIDIPINAPFVDNDTRRHFTNGYSRGLLKRELPRKNGCSLIEFIPIDQDQSSVFSTFKKPEPQVQAVVVHNTMIKRSPRGDRSSRREIVTLTSRNPADLPESMQNTAQGEWMTREGQLAWLKKTFGDAIPAGDMAIADIMKEYARGNISAAGLASIREEAAETNKIARARMLTDPGQPADSDANKKQ